MFMPIRKPSNSAAVNTQFQLCWSVVALLESTIFYLENTEFRWHKA